MAEVKKGKLFSLGKDDKPGSLLFPDVGIFVQLSDNDKRRKVEQEIVKSWDEKLFIFRALLASDQAIHYFICEGSQVDFEPFAGSDIAQGWVSLINSELQSKGII